MSTENLSTVKIKTEKKVCPTCGGAGWLRRDVPVDHPDFGRALPCHCKVAETRQAALDSLRQSSGVVHLSQLTFERFKADGVGLSAERKKNLRDTFERARKFADAPRGWLVLKGGYGCGKTHLAAAIANERLARGAPVLFIVAPDLLDHLRATFAPTSEITYDERFETVRSAELLILDDFGAQSATAWANEKMFQLFNHRYNAQLATVITTNRDLEDLDPRLRSRFADSSLSSIATILAPDYRQAGVDTRGSQLSNLGMYSEMQFETFELRGDELKSHVRDNLRRVFNKAKDFAEHPAGLIVFTGAEHGCGKTHLAAAIANKLAQNGDNVSFVTVPDLLDHLRAAFAPGAVASYDQRFEDTRNATILVLDDLGTENATPWAREKLFQIIDHRYVSRLPTIITTNWEAEVDPRIKSRIFDLARSSVEEILAPSYRTTHRRAEMKNE
ncbi:MAG: ATP-binding protein, partial [Chloroflexi bacterium]|nr:ATP-binding protein [Chloroflexota bacterium]